MLFLVNFDNVERETCNESWGFAFELEGFTYMACSICC